MKTILMMVPMFLVAMCGCSRGVVALSQPERAPMPDEVHLRKLLELTRGPEVFDCFANAINNATNKDDVWPVFAAQLRRNTIENIAETHTISEINRKLDTLRRGTNQHPYTEEELRAALQIKEQAALSRAAKKTLSR